LDCTEESSDLSEEEELTELEFPEEMERTVLFVDLPAADVSGDFCA
jgi:hypothetical protein